MTELVKVPEGYEFVKIISSGGFGSVVEMREKATKNHYAGKMMQCLTEIDKQRIDREEVVSMDNTKVIVMELGGKSLAAIVSEYTACGEKMPRNVVYRVMDDMSGTLQALDFGAAEAEDVSSTRTVMSMPYVSPERMESESGKATPEADVWALGVVLHRLLFGEPLFKSTNPARLMRDILSFKVSLIGSECGEEERALLMRMLDPVPETRITNVWMLSDADKTELSTKILDTQMKLDAEHAERRKEHDAHLKTKLVLERIEKEGGMSGVVEDLMKQNERLRVSMKGQWEGTSSLHTLDPTSHQVTPTILSSNHIVEEGTPFWRTAFTLPLDEGEWELKIRATQSTMQNVSLGFLQHPLPPNATQLECGAYHSGIGGNFILWHGRMWREGKELRPAGTNMRCQQFGQTAAIRVNMSTREARLVVDEKDQPGIFTDIPSPLCLGITSRRDTAVHLSFCQHRFSSRI
ncbi:hypothetical protein BLNAU_11665 [Blattamonas nauphoetae]|uniref:non-specific serine/threonine protein kinase n=1 Tax=Blattamonas nauphoetae TaxID=2049346 RepID=A0ABQ9XR56_9EUKA|nr:hypothetical protein BLNAU_11665 [Blattamonas nauphoetae]